jgi:hypothetical protein
MDVVLEEIIRGRKTVHSSGKKFFERANKRIGANINDTSMMHQLNHLFEMHFMDPNQTRP